MIPILRAEKHFILVNKPAGLLSQAPPGVASLEKELREQIRNVEQHQGKPFVRLPHRLDRETSGIMLIARNQRALKRFGQQFQSRKIGKYYLAVLSGPGVLPTGPQFWSDWVRKIPDEARAEIVEAKAEGGRVAELEAEEILSVGAFRLVLIRLFTGRMHQIRLQAASRGCPVLGDAKYGSKEEFGLAVDSQHLGVSSKPIALHALRIEFRHPQSALTESGTAEVPASWHHLPQKMLEAVHALQRKSLDDQNASWTQQNA